MGRFWYKQHDSPTTSQSICCGCEQESSGSWSRRQESHGCRPEVESSVHRLTRQDEVIGLMMFLDHQSRLSVGRQHSSAFARAEVSDVWYQLLAMNCSARSPNPQKRWTASVVAAAVVWPFSQSERRVEEHCERRSSRWCYYLKRQTRLGERGLDW